MNRLTIASAALLSLGLIATGCLVVDDDGMGCYGDYCGADPGDFGFWWAFELPDGSVTDSCTTANVARVDARVWDDYGYLDYEVPDRPCGDLGLDLVNFRPGWYELQLTGHCPTGHVTHEAWISIWVDEGYNDYGVLTLDYLGRCY